MDDDQIEYQKSKEVKKESQYEKAMSVTDQINYARSARMTAEAEAKRPLLNKLSMKIGAFGHSVKEKSVEFSTNMVENQKREQYQHRNERQPTQHHQFSMRSSSPKIFDAQVPDFNPFGGGRKGKRNKNNPLF